MRNIPADNTYLAPFTIPYPNDMVSGQLDCHPKVPHYDVLNPSPISVINDWGLTFNAGNVVKYIARYQFKGDPIGDLRKAAQYIQFEIERLSKEVK